MGKKIISTNRKAFHEYHIFDKFNAGMVLTGTEIKSIRKGAINLKDSFVKVDNSEVFLYNCHISPYEQGNRYNHEEKRTRKLLLNKREIDKLIGRIKKDGYAIKHTNTREPQKCHKGDGTRFHNRRGDKSNRLPHLC